MGGTDLYHRLFGIVSPYFRKRRIIRFFEELQPQPGTAILDLGGYPANWRDVPLTARIVTLNLSIVPGSEQVDERCTPVIGDATSLTFSDQSFDIVFSNSVIEHLGTFERQQAFAREARRVGRQLWIQTPARCFPIEPHYLAPFVHWLPRGVQKLLIRNFTLFGWLHRPTTAGVEAVINEIRLLSKLEMESLFPDCSILAERWMGLPKSYVAVRL